MAIATRIRDYLENHHIPYQLVHHPYAETARGCAEAAHIPPARMTKAVLLKDDQGYLLALVPADRSINLNTLGLRTNRILRTASQREVKELFDDCTRGAVPAIGQAYDLRLIWDEQIVQQPDCYLEAGDHEELVYLSRKEFQALMENRDHGQICH